MKEIEIEIKNEQGLHARPAGRLVNLVKSYDGDIKIIYEVKNSKIEVNAKNIFEVMSLGAEKGSKLLFKINGNEEDKISNEIRELIEINKFFEE